MTDRDKKTKADGVATEKEAVETTVSNVAPLRKTVPCPECRQPSSREHYPFCSNRCRNIDLNRWLSGAYAIPVSDEEETADERSGTRREE